MKNKIDRVTIYLYIFGFIVSVTPLFCQWYASLYQGQIVQSYQTMTNSITLNQKKDCIQNAIQMNDFLFQTQENHGLNSINKDIIKSNKILRFEDTNVFAHLEIPCIELKVPIFHGVQEENLINGVGHVDKSSYPVPSKSARSILLGHRGSAKAQLFTRLDELKKGDLIYVHVLDHTMCYQVNNIEVVEPCIVETYKILENQNLLTLVTCTPYGINSHRLVVHAIQIPYKEKIKKEIQVNFPSFRECIFLCIPLIFIIGFILEVKKYISNRMIEI